MMDFSPPIERTDDSVLIVRSALVDPKADDVAKAIEREKISVVGKLGENLSSEIGNILASLYIEHGGSNIGNHEQVSRLQTLRHRLLAYVPPRALAQRPVSWNQIVRDSVSVLSAQIQISGVRLSLHLDPGFPLLLGDPSQLEHAMVSILVNGLQALPTKRGVLTITTSRSSGYYKIKVRDFGKGMDTQTALRLFEPFFSTRSDGFGLGLYGSKRIVQAHGWDLRVKTKLKRGTSVEIIIRSGRKHE